MKYCSCKSPILIQAGDCPAGRWWTECSSCHKRPAGNMGPKEDKVIKDTVSRHTVYEIVWKATFGTKGETWDHGGSSKLLALDVIDAIEQFEKQMKKDWKKDTITSNLVKLSYVSVVDKDTLDL